MKKYCLVAFSLLTILSLSCKKRYDAPVPDLNWDLFNSPTAKALQNNTGKKMEGVYTITGGNGRFGDDAAVKWSYTATGGDTVYHLSFFCQKDITYCICEGRRVDSSILLNGYWRRMIGTETGKVRLTIDKNNGAAKLLSNDTLKATDSIVINGTYGRAGGQ